MWSGLPEMRVRFSVSVQGYPAPRIKASHSPNSSKKRAWSPEALGERTDTIVIQVVILHTYIPPSLQYSFKLQPPPHLTLRHPLLHHSHTRLPPPTDTPTPNGLRITLHKPILDRHPLNLLVAQKRQLPRGPHITRLLQIPLREDEINLLEGATGRLGVEEVDDGEEAGVDDGEEEVRAPADAADHDGRDHDDQEVEEPIAAGRERVGFGARFDRVDLGGVELSGEGALVRAGMWGGGWVQSARVGNVPKVVGARLRRRRRCM